MPAFIRHIGIDGQTQKKLRQAAPIATMYSRQADVAEWDGAACDVVVAGTKEPTAQTAMERASAAGIPVVVVGDHAMGYEAHYSIAPESSITDITRALKVALDYNQ